MPNFRAMRDSLRQKGVQVTIQWNPVNTVTNGPKKIGRINEVVVVFFLQENRWLFCRAAKKSGRNHEVTVLPR